jgi:hypothetical protein
LTMTTQVPEQSHSCLLEAKYAAGGLTPEADINLSPPSDLQRFDPPAVKLEIRGVTPHLQSLLWSKHTIHKNTIAAKLRASGASELALSLENCHSTYTIQVCGRCNTVMKFPNRCDRLWCPECQPRLQREREKAVAWWAAEITQPKHVVLTVKNVNDFSKAHVLEFKSWFTKLRRSKFCRNWVGGFYSIEVTNEGTGWHLHLHALVEAKWIDSIGLSEAWSKATNGMGRIVKVKDARGKDYLHEVTKYVAKGSQLAAWSGQNTLRFIQAFDSVRTFGVFGKLYGLRTKFAEWLEAVQTAKPKCNCGSCDVRYYTESEFLELELRPDPETKSLPPPQTLDCLTPWLALDITVNWTR